MPSALTKRRGADLNCRFAVNGIQYASRLLGEMSAKLAATLMSGSSRVDRDLKLAE